MRLCLTYDCIQAAVLAATGCNQPQTNSPSVSPNPSALRGNRRPQTLPPGRPNVDFECAASPAATTHSQRMIVVILPHAGNSWPFLK